MKVFVTGATGFIGSHAVKSLINNGHDVRLYVRNSEKASKMYRAIGYSINDIVVGEITNRLAVSNAMIECDAVLHAAAATPLQNVSADDMFSTNFNGVRTVIDSACEQGIGRIVYVSSVTAIFRPLCHNQRADDPVVSSSHAYGKSKAEAEKYVRLLQERGAPIKTIYPGGVVGPDDPGLSATLMSLIHRLSKEFIITSGGTQQIDVRDLALIITRLLEKDDKVPGRYLTVGHYYEWKRFSQLLENITGKSLMKRTVPGWFLRSLGKWYDIQRFVRHVDSPLSAETMNYATRWLEMNNDPLIRSLGIQLTTPTQTFTDTISWLLSRGLISPADAPLLSRPSR